jgi:NurA domain
MPYPGEFAHHRSVLRLASTPLVQDLKQRCKVRLPETAESGGSSLPPCAAIERTLWLPEWIVAIDGSHLEIPLRNGFPGAEVSYLSIASVMLNVNRMRILDARRPVDPHEFNKLERVDAIDCALPGCNVVIDDDLNAQQSFRTQLQHILEHTRMVEGGENLLQTYEALLGHKPVTRDQACPYDDCGARPPIYKRSSGQYSCDCLLNRPLFSSDALRIHEGMNPAGTNGAMYAEVSQVLEHVWLINILRTIEQQEWLSSLRRLAFVIDGPLAVFGHPAWLSEAIIRELRRLNGRAREVNNRDLLILGIEKSGPFFEHLQQLDIRSSGQRDCLPRSTSMLLTDRYIKRNIIFSDSNKPYGSQTYYGRKFFYKTRSGARIVGVLPFLRDGDDDLNRAEASQYPRLPDALNILDELVSARYPDAVVPLIAAHAEAAIPIQMGRRVLEQIAREMVGESQ